MPRLVAVLCALLVLAGCAGTDLSKQPPSARSTIPAKDAADAVATSTGAAPTGTAGEGPVDPAFAVDKLRLIDPCALLERDLLAQLGTPGETSRSGFSRCSNFMKDKNKKDLAVTVDVGQSLTAELNNAKKQLAGLKSHEQVLPGSACFVSVITQEKPGLGITVQIGSKEDEPCAPGRVVAEAVVKKLKTKPSPVTPAKGSLLTLDACSLPDKAAVTAAAGTQARTYPYGLHTCSWLGDSEEAGLDFRLGFVPRDKKFDPKQTEVDLGNGVVGYQVDGSTAFPTCTIKWVQRLASGDEGETVEVKSAGPSKATFNRCERAQALAKAVLPKIPRP
ncbi:DUF3558 domain-containing protein [Saccharothrix violaceirubra]|uniref:DUF3558 domain-containing protein n=1 Tax=Saccharothrix violaceirubra TaxID=413306 RepID=A0A7W7T087_9PSEU|nr:hypothetical protein [Saccharothrix violaceirubra]MBB4963612.1 hypothetical protein [Saccharothrix violaceirubra]